MSRNLVPLHERRLTMPDVRRASAQTRSVVRLATDIDTVRAEALFASDVQPASAPDRAEAIAAIDRTMRRYGGEHGCVDRLAREYGEHPEAAAERMRWAIEVVHTLFTPDLSGQLARSAAPRR